MGEISQNHELGPKAITSSSAVPKERHSVVLWPPGHALQMNRMLSAQRIRAGRGLLGLSRGDLAVVHDIPRRRLRQSSRERPMRPSTLRKLAQTFTAHWLVCNARCPPPHAVVKAVCVAPGWVGRGFARRIVTLQDSSPSSNLSD